MNNSSKSINNMSSMANSNNTQSYTYSHYYKNTRPYQTRMNNTYQAHSNRNTFSNTPHPNSYKNNQQHYNSNNKNSKHQQTSQYQSNNYNNTINNNENLLLNDVYGKSESSSTSSNNSTYDFSSILNSFFQNNSNSDECNNNSSNFEMPDIETLLKFKKIFERFNSKSTKNDPMINLLYAIKPFMHNSKRNLIDQLTKFLTISSALQDFNIFM